MILAVGDTYNSAGLTGGSATTKLVVNNIPSHNHSCGTSGNHSHTKGSMNITGTFRGVDRPMSGAFTRIKEEDGYMHYGTSEYTDIANIDFNASRSWTGSTSTNGNHAHTIGNTGSGTAFNTISPYITAYVWRRTA